jgi:hypothetical protein
VGDAVGDAVGVRWRMRWGMRGRLGACELPGDEGHADSGRGLDVNFGGAWMGARVKKTYPENCVELSLS